MLHKPFHLTAAVYHIVFITHRFYFMVKLRIT